MIAYILLVSAAAIALGLIQPAYAYPTFIDQAVPAKWTDLYFSVCVSNLADARYEKLFLNAIDQWKSAWPHFDYVIRQNQDGCDIDLTITRDSVGLPKEEHSQGTTRLTYWDYRQIVSGDITIPTQIKELVKQGDFCCKELIYEISEKKFYIIALHEFGHALGLAHAEDDGEEPFDIMTARGEHNRYIVSAVAIETLDSIYGKSTKARDHPISVEPSVTVELEMDKDRYVFDDSVRVTGKVSKIGGTGKIMLLKLLDSSPSMSLNAVADFTPNDDGSFAADIDLKTDESGEWELLVQYLGVSKTMLFGVDEIPYRALAQTDKASYSVRDIVRINGNVTRYGDRVSIDVINPDGINFANTVAPILPNKKFNAEFTLKESKFTIEGEWTVRMTYADRINELTFIVAKPSLQHTIKTDESKTGKDIVEFKVQAKQIRDVVIIRVTKADNAKLDVYGFRLYIPDSAIKAFRGPAEWSKEDLPRGATVSTLLDLLHMNDEAYFLLKVDAVKPHINWVIHDLRKNTLAEGSTVII